MCNLKLKKLEMSDIISWDKAIDMKVKSSDHGEF